MYGSTCRLQVCATNNESPQLTARNHNLQYAPYKPSFPWPCLVWYGPRLLLCSCNLYLACLFLVLAVVVVYIPSTCGGSSIQQRGFGSAMRDRRIDMPSSVIARHHNVFSNHISAFKHTQCINALASGISDLIHMFLCCSFSDEF